MSMHRLVNAVKMYGDLAANKYTNVKIGIVANYDPSRYAARVRYQPEDIESPWLPIFSNMVGAGWGFICPPAIGATAAVLFVDGQIDAGFIVLFGFGKETPPPTNDVEPGGFLFYNKEGTQIKVTAAGDVKISAATGKKVEIFGNTTISAGNATNEFKKMITEAFQEKFNQHTHPGISTPPDAEYYITNEQMTEVLKGN